METKNAIIESARITSDDHGCLSAWLMLDYGGSGQTPAQLYRSAERDIGLRPEEAIEYAYENIQQEAKIAVAGVREA